MATSKDLSIEAAPGYLQKAGYRVDICEDGARCLERVRLAPPRLLITEILVPTLDGLNVCRAIKADSETQHVIVLVVSFLAAEDRAREVGADMFLQKPLQETALIQAVERLITPAARRDPEYGKS